MRIPKYCKNGDGRAFVSHPSIPGKSRRLYLGKYGSRESRERYEAWITNFFVLHEETLAAAKAPRSRSVAELVVEYLAFARGYYALEGRPSKEFVAVKASLRHLLDLFQDELGSTLGPRHIRQLQQHLIALGYRRGVINLRVGRVKRFVKWCCAHELIPAPIYQGLIVVGGLRRGRSAATESRKVLPVPLQHVQDLLPFMSPVLRAMVQLQYLCGMRPAEVCIMRPVDLDLSGGIWLYRPASHKTQLVGRSLVKAITPEAQEVLAPFLDRPPHEYCFSPRETKEWRYNRREYVTRPERKTPVYPSELRARERRKAELAARRGSSRRWGVRYSTDSYRRAIEYAHRLAEQNGIKIPHWHPHQLRHTIATQISHTLGEQAASVWLGHASLNTTAIYTERNVAELVSVALKVSRSGLAAPPAEQSAAAHVG